MSDWDDNSNDANSGQNGSNANNGGGLRKQLEDALAELKTLKTANETLQQETRRSKITDLLTAKKLDAKVAKLIPADIAPTKEAVDKWFEEYGDIFNIQQSDSGDGSTSSSATAGDQTSPADLEEFEAQQHYIATMRQMGNVTGGALPPERAAELFAKINDPALTQEGLISLINQHGGGAGMG